VSTCGVYCALCLPRRRCASFERDAEVLPLASTMYSGAHGAGLGEYGCHVGERPRFFMTAGPVRKGGSLLKQLFVCKARNATGEASRPPYSRRASPLRGGIYNVSVISRDLSPWIN